MAWVVVAMRLQLELCEHGGCVMQIQKKWFKHFDRKRCRNHRLVLETPTESRKRVRKKTSPEVHTSTLSTGLSAFLTKAWYEEPYCAGSQQWPFAGTTEVGDEAYLFPGMTQRGSTQTRNQKTHLLRTSYTRIFRRLAKVLKAEVEECKANGQYHPFSNFDLNRLGPHSFRYTSITHCIDAGTDIKLVASMAANTPGMIHKVYNQSTIARKATVTEDVLGKFGKQAGNPKASSDTCAEPGHEEDLALLTRQMGDNPASNKKFAVTLAGLLLSWAGNMQ